MGERMRVTRENAPDWTPPKVEVVLRGKEDDGDSKQRSCPGGFEDAVEDPNNNLAQGEVSLDPDAEREAVLYRRGFIAVVVHCISIPTPSADA
ncbi:MAG: hypothetical protein CL912_16540 [Deltaproteobacteria bacterium]|nr:hypothetical protein [Deltaproteobacteria bacterium]